MHNCIGRRAAVAGVDRMAVEDVVGSVLLFPLNDGALVFACTEAAMCAVNGKQPSSALTAQAASAQISKSTERVLANGFPFAPLSIIAAAGPRAGTFPMPGQVAECRI